MQARTQKAFELSLSYQKKYDNELRDYLQNYNHDHPDSRIRLNGGYFRSVRIWDETLEECLEICIRVRRTRICGTGCARVFQSSFLIPRRHYLRSFIEETLSSVLRQDSRLSIVRCSIEREISPSTWWRWHLEFPQSTLAADAPSLPSVYICPIYKIHSTEVIT